MSFVATSFSVNISMELSQRRCSSQLCQTSTVTECRVVVITLPQRSSWIDRLRSVADRLPVPSWKYVGFSVFKRHTFCFGIKSSVHLPWLFVSRLLQPQRWLQCKVIVYVIDHTTNILEEAISFDHLLVEEVKMFLHCGIVALKTTNLWKESLPSGSRSCMGWMHVCCIHELTINVLCSEKNTHSHFLSYLHEWCVDLNKNFSEYA